MITPDEVSRELTHIDLTEPYVRRVSERFSVAPGTLQRQLTEQGTSLRVLVGRERNRRAGELLKCGEHLASHHHTLGFRCKTSVYKWRPHDTR